MDNRPYSLGTVIASIDRDLVIQIEMKEPYTMPDSVMVEFSVNRKSLSYANTVSITGQLITITVLESVVKTMTNCLMIINVDGILLGKQIQPATGVRDGLGSIDQVIVSSDDGVTSIELAGVSAVQALTGLANQASISATASEVSAATSEANALNSETSAASSASSASDSAISASSYASIATIKANEASMSASSALSSQDAAATSESNTATSESNANTSASSANDSAVIASEKADIAATKASEASTSATNSATSASSASTSAGNAATSETNASNSASSASTSASTATTKASEAVTSANSASGSATSASTSASTATTKASEAATSATSAFNSATNANTSYQSALAIFGNATDVSNAVAAAQSAKTSAETARDIALAAKWFPVVTELTASRTLSLTDAGKEIRCTYASAVTITVPTQSSVAWAEDTEIVIAQAGAGQVTIIGAVGVTINTSETLKTSKRYSYTGLKRVGVNVWDFTGERQIL